MLDELAARMGAERHQPGAPLSVLPPQRLARADSHRRGDARAVDRSATDLECEGALEERAALAQLGRAVRLEQPREVGPAQRQQLALAEHVRHKHLPNEHRRRAARVHSHAHGCARMRTDAHGCLRRRTQAHGCARTHMRTRTRTCTVTMHTSACARIPVLPQRAAAVRSVVHVAGWGFGRKPGFRLHISDRGLGQQLAALQAVDDARPARFAHGRAERERKALPAHDKVDVLCLQPSQPCDARAGVCARACAYVGVCARVWVCVRAVGVCVRA